MQRVRQVAFAQQQMGGKEEHRKRPLEFGGPLGATAITFGLPLFVLFVHIVCSRVGVKLVVASSLSYWPDASCQWDFTLFDTSRYTLAEVKAAVRDLPPVVFPFYLIRSFACLCSCGLAVSCCLATPCFDRYDVPSSLAVCVTGPVCFVSVVSRRC